MKYLKIILNKSTYNIYIIITLIYILLLILYIYKCFKKKDKCFKKMIIYMFLKH